MTSIILRHTTMKCAKQESSVWYAIAMRLMGIDYGTKRIGVALSDDQGLMAFPHAVFLNDASFMEKLEGVIKKEGVGKIVIGHSINREGTPNTVHALVEEFIQDLTLRFGLPIELEPEQYTTQEAIRFQGRTDMTDAAAASVILNSYIMRLKNTK